MLARDLGTWPNIVGTGKEGSESGMVEDWSMDKRREKEVTNTDII